MLKIPSLKELLAENAAGTRHTLVAAPRQGQVCEKQAEIPETANGSDALPASMAEGGSVTSHCHWRWEAAAATSREGEDSASAVARRWGEGGSVPARGEPATWRCWRAVAAATSTAMGGSAAAQERLWEVAGFCKMPVICQKCEHIRPAQLACCGMNTEHRAHGDWPLLGSGESSKGQELGSLYLQLVKLQDAPCLSGRKFV